MGVNFRGCVIPKRDSPDGAKAEGFVVLSSLKKTHGDKLLARVRRAVRDSYLPGSKQVVVDAFIVPSSSIGSNPSYYVKLLDCERLDGPPVYQRERSSRRKLSNPASAMSQPSLKMCASRIDQRHLAIAETALAYLSSANSFISVICEMLEDHITRPRP